MPTAHVSTGAIAGVAGTESSRLNLVTLGKFAVAWMLTPAVGRFAAVTDLLT